MKRNMFLLSAICLAGACVTIHIGNDLLDSQTEDFYLEKGSSLSFDNTNGDFELREWSNEYVQVETRIYGDSSKGIPEDLNVTFEETAGELNYFVEYPNGMNVCSVDFVVQIPEKSEFSISHETVNGETLIIADVNVYVETVNGDIQLDVLSSTGISTTNGDVAAVLKEQSEAVSVATVNGDLDISVPEEMSISVETVNGDISFQEIEAEDELRIDGTSDETMQVETVNGDIELRHLNGQI